MNNIPLEHLHPLIAQEIVGSSPLMNDHHVLMNVRFIHFQDFKALGHFPRYPNNENIVKRLEEINLEEFNKNLMIFISHCWIRGSSNSPGWDGTPHPDDSNNSKYHLCIEGIEKLLSIYAPGMEGCYLWFDYGCIDQDKDPAGELKMLDKVIQICDCIVTPMVDLNHQQWEYPSKGWFHYFTEYLSEGWYGTPVSYLNRGWCRIEMFYAANIPLFPDTEERRNKMRAGLKDSRERKKRPHFLYGTKESASSLIPFILPSLSNSYFDEFHPEQGHLSHESDRVVIRRLVNELLPFMTEILEGYQGEYNEEELRHGFGRYQYIDGTIYEGYWEKDIQTGFGIWNHPDGLKFEGNHLHGKYHGKGKEVHPSGCYYIGDYCHGIYHGKGILKHFDGSKYEGDFIDGKYHGNGIHFYVDGEVYEGQFFEGRIEGHGIYRYLSGDSYEGEWVNGEKHGHGIYRYHNGDCYEGEYLHDEKHGPGVYRYANGKVCELMNGQIVRKVRNDNKGSVVSLIAHSLGLSIS